MTRRAERTTIGVQSGCVCLRCPHCGAVDLIAGEIKGRTFMVRWNKFRRAHDWRCAIKAEHAAHVAEIEGVVADVLRKAATA